MKFYTKKINYLKSSLIDQIQKLQSFKILHIQSFVQLEFDEIIKKCVPLEEDPQGNKTGGLWVDIKYDPNDTASFRTSDTAQPLHTDGSYESNAPKIVFFQCLEQATLGGDTIFIDFDEVIQLVSLKNPKLLIPLSTIPIVFSKGNDKKTSLIIDLENKTLCWNYFRADKTEFVEDFHHLLEEYAVKGGLCTRIKLEKNDAVFFHDNKVLHGRHSFCGNRWLRKGGFTTF